MGYALVADLSGFYDVTILGDAIGAPAQQAALDARSSEADGYILPRYSYAYPLPQPYDPSLVRKVCDLAWYDLLVFRGFNPESGADSNYKTNMLLAIEWLKGVRNQSISLLNVPVLTSASQNGASPLVLSDPLQGFIPGPCGSWPRPNPSGIG